jgi:hypothetical protein
MLLLFCVQVVFYSEKIQWSALLFAASAASLIWSILVRPKLLVYDEGLTVINPFSTSVIPFAEIETIDTRWALTFTTKGKQIRVWVAPAPGRYHAKSVRASELTGLELSSPEIIGPGDSPRSHSGAAAQIVKFRIKSASKDVIPVTSSMSFNYFAVTIICISGSISLILSWLHI